MATFGTPLSPRLIKGGIVTMDPDTSVVISVIALQYNPDSLSRSLQIQAVPGGADGVRVDALRLRGPAIETIKVEAELDATDQLEFPNQYPLAGPVSYTHLAHTRQRGRFRGSVWSPLYSVSAPVVGAATSARRRPKRRYSAMR